MIVRILPISGEQLQWKILCLHVCVYNDIHMSKYIYIYIHIHVDVGTYVYNIYIYTYIHTYITLHYSTSHQITSHHITSHYIKSHYIYTCHVSIHIYIYTCIQRIASRDLAGKNYVPNSQNLSPTSRI